MESVSTRAALTMFICTRCGVQYAPSETSPSRCVLCDEEGRAVPICKPPWTTLADMARRHQNIMQRLDEDLYTIRTMPAFGSGQQSMIVRSAGGSILFDCVALYDSTTVGLVKAVGGATSIVVSHPRHAGSAVEWSHAFGGIPVYIHETGRRWTARPDPVVRFWEGDRLRLHDDITLVHAGADDGGVLLHWPDGARGRGVLFAGAVLQVVDTARVGFLWSASTQLPRSARAVRRLVHAMDGLEYDALYDASCDRAIPTNARRVFLRSAEQYLASVDES